MVKELLLYFALLLWFVVPLQAQPTIFAEDVEAETGEEVEVLVRVKDFTDIIAWQFTFEWDSEVLEFLDFPQLNLTNLDTLNFGPASIDNFLISVWTENQLQATSFPDDEVIFSMRFKVIGEAPDSSKLWFSGNEAANNLVGANGEQLEFKTEMGMFTIPVETSAVQQIPENFDLTVSPNPFQNSTQIKFNLDKSYTDFQVSIFTVDGTQVYESTGDLSAGEHILNMSADMLPSTGMYLMHMTSENVHTTHKIIYENY